MHGTPRGVPDPVHVAHLPDVFVGRREELALFQALLEARPAGAIVYVGAPAGMGKTRLLDAFERAATLDRHNVTRLSAMQLPPVPKRIRAVVHKALSAAPERHVILLDDFQAHARLERWYGTELLPALATDTLCIVAGRVRLARALVEKLRKAGTFEERNLPPLHEDAAETLLHARGVSEQLIPAVIDLAGGIPLVLEELARIYHQRGPAARGSRPRQEALATLFRRIHTDIPTDDHRRALWAAALASPASPRLLAATVDSADTRTHYRWLARQTFICVDRDRLWPDSVYRDAAMLDLLRSAPTQYRTMLWRAGQFLLAQFNAQRSFDERRETIAALLHLQRPPASASDGTAGGRAAVQALASDQAARAALRGLRGGGGQVPEAILEALLSQPGECVILQRRHDEVLGVMHFASSTNRRGTRDRARQALDHVDRLACIDRPGRRRKTSGPRALVCSVWLAEPVDRHSPACDTAYRVLLERTLAPPDLRIMALRSDLCHPALTDMAQRSGLLSPPPAPDPGEPMQQRHPPWLLLRDNDREPPGKWLRMQLGRSISGQEEDPSQVDGLGGGTVEISRRDFADAVRQALPRMGSPAELVNGRLGLISGGERGGSASDIRQFVARGLEVMAQNKHSRADARRLRRHYHIGDPLSPEEADDGAYDSPGEVRAAEDRLVSALWQEHIQRLRARSSA